MKAYHTTPSKKKKKLTKIAVNVDVGAVDVAVGVDLQMPLFADDEPNLPGRSHNVRQVGAALEPCGSLRRRFVQVEEIQGVQSGARGARGGGAQQAD